jgi:class 3 adenylate cyclase
MPPPPAPPARAPALKTAAAKAAPLVVKGTAAPAVVTKVLDGTLDGPMKSETAVVFLDLARFQIASRRIKDEVLVGLLEDYYERIADGLKPAGGRVVKFMGDGALVVFPVERTSQAARALLMLKSAVDSHLAKKKFSGAVVARLHVTDLMAGAIGPKGDKRYDVLGSGVNRTAAMRAGEGIGLSAEAYAKLDAKTQKLFVAKGDLFVPAP